MNIRDELRALTAELVEATSKKEAYELEFELEKAKTTFDAQVVNLSNQVMRDAQVVILLEQSGASRKMAELRTRAKLAWYRWAAVKSLVDGKHETN